MSDMYYNDTKAAMEDVESIDLDLMDSHYSEKIDKLRREAEGLLDQYSEKLERIEELESILDDNDISHA